MSDADKLKGAIRIFWSCLPAEVQRGIMDEARARAMSLRALLESYRISWRRNDDGSWSFSITTKGGDPNGR
jgi:hypothetical protein